MTSTILSTSLGVQKAQTHWPGRSREATYAPNAPLRMTTWPLPSLPTPISRNREVACSIDAGVGGPSIERSDRASSAFGLDQTNFSSIQKPETGDPALPEDVDVRQHLREGRQFFRNAPVLPSKRKDGLHVTQG